MPEASLHHKVHRRIRSLRKVHHEERITPLVKRATTLAVTLRAILPRKSSELEFLKDQGDQQLRASSLNFRKRSLGECLWRRERSCSINCAFAGTPTKTQRTRNMPRRSSNIFR